MILILKKGIGIESQKTVQTSQLTIKKPQKQDGTQWLLQKKANCKAFAIHILIARI